MDTTLNVLYILRTMLFNSSVLQDYSFSLFRTTPIELYAGIICVLVIGFVVSLWAYGYKRGVQIISLINFVVYGIYVICTTVVFRPSRLESSINFTPLWSYVAINNGETRLIAENLMNVVAFIPIGMFLAIGIRMARWWQVAIVSCSVSITVEVLQYFFKRGLCELDDILHNTIGSLTGYMLIKGMWLLYRKVRSL